MIEELVRCAYSDANAQKENIFYSKENTFYLASGDMRVL